MTPEELQQQMDEALEAARDHLRAIRQLQTEAETNPAGLDDKTFRQINGHQKGWEREMEKYMLASIALMKQQ